MADGEGLVGSAALNLKLVDVQVLDESGGVIIRYRISNS
jgi:hypothetical protein